MLKESCFVIMHLVCLNRNALAEVSIVPRSEWNAKPPKAELTPLETPVERIIIAHTAGNECKTKIARLQEVLNIQNFHMIKGGFDDISNNFLIGNDVNVHEGRGSVAQGAIAKGFNAGSISIGYMGVFIKDLPSQAALDAGQDNVRGGSFLRIVPRDGWLAQPPVNPWVPLDLPVDRVIIIPTRTSNCETQAACTYTVRFTQTFNIESQQQDDIIYNFMIGGDGNVYEGRGWDNRGSAVIGFNDDSISLAFIGSFNRNKPSDKQMNITKLLLEEGVRLGKISPDYRIVGSNKLDPASTTTATDALYKSFEDWPHWSDK